MKFGKPSLLIGYLLLILCMVLVRARAEPGTARLSITVFDCTPHSGKAPSLFIEDIDRRFTSVPVSPRWTTGPPVWRTTVQIQAGHYIVSAGSSPCGGETEQLVALAGYTRHLAITLNRVVTRAGRVAMVTVDEDMYAGAVYGILPNPMSSVEMMSATSIIGEQTRRTAKIDGMVFEFDHMIPGRYVLRLDAGDVAVSREVIVPKGFMAQP